jgi:hypothetical protein
VLAMNFEAGIYIRCSLASQIRWQKMLAKPETSSQPHMKCLIPDCDFKQAPLYGDSVLPFQCYRQNNFSK